MDTLDSPERFDVIVVGTGLAGMSAALAARESGARVLVVDKAPETSMGGNTRFSSGGLRTPSESFGVEDLVEENLRMSDRRADPRLTRILYERANSGVEWLREQGALIQDPHVERPDFRGSKVPWHAKGNGYGLLASLFPQIAKQGIEVRFETKALDLVVRPDGSVAGLRVRSKGGETLLSGNVILACGNFQANVEMRTRYLGKGADSLIVRGSRYNTGDGLRMALAAGAQSYGNWGDFHSAVLDARSAPLECGETNINTYQYSLIVNSEGRRFVDEGAAFFDVTYVAYSRKILEQPGGRAFCVFDAKIAERGLVFGVHEEFEPFQAGSIQRLAELLSIDAANLEQTIETFNSSVKEGEFDPLRLDGKGTSGITPPKSNWALPLDTPPYFAFPLTGGVTFALGGLKTDDRCRVIDTEDRAIKGLYAAGEIMGGLFFGNYPGGASLVRSFVFGRIAGHEAAESARKAESLKATA